jgi:hypothetical protein
LEAWGLAVRYGEVVVRLLCGCFGWEEDGEAGTAFRAIRGRDGAAVDANYRFHEGEAEAVAAGVAPFGAALEEVLANGGVEAGAVVLDG